MSVKRYVFAMMSAFCIALLATAGDLMRGDVLFVFTFFGVFFGLISVAQSSKQFLYPVTSPRACTGFVFYIQNFESPPKKANCTRIWKLRSDNSRSEDWFQIRVQLAFLAALFTTILIPIKNSRPKGPAVFSPVFTYPLRFISSIIACFLLPGKPDPAGISLPIITFSMRPAKLS